MLRGIQSTISWPWLLSALLLGGLSTAAQALPPGPVTSRIVMVGDILLGDQVQSRLKKYGYDFPLRRLAPVVQGKDLLIGNLEGPITRYTVPLDPHKAYAYHADPQTAQVLKQFGFDLMCLANNHLLDYGPPGMFDTLDALDQAGIRHFGAGANQSAATQGVIVNLKGLRLGFLGFLHPYGKYEKQYPWFAGANQPGVARMDQANVTAAIKAMRPQVDLLIASFHWGENYAPVLPIQKQFAHLAVDQGADLVIGHHPHVPQGVETYHGVPIVYSLGNFAFGSPGRFRLVDPLLSHGWVAEITLSNKHISHLGLKAIAVDNDTTGFQARPADPTVLPRLVSFVQQGFAADDLRVNGAQAEVRLP